MKRRRCRVGLVLVGLVGAVTPPGGLAAVGAREAWRWAITCEEDRVRPAHATGDVLAHLLAGRCGACVGHGEEVGHILALLMRVQEATEGVVLHPNSSGPLPRTGRGPGAAEAAPGLEQE